MRVTCGGCSKEWGGLRAAHCSRCHRTFSSVNAFDIHQVWTKKPFVCNEPAACGMVYDKDKDLYRFMNPDEEKDANGTVHSPAR
jgi:predicted amidophosphoribosyltransferase